MYFCTYFDSYYLLKGLGLYMSLEKVTDDFHLYVMAFDTDCYDKLLSYNFKHMTVELWDEWETPEIKKVKGDRNKAEYCWTCGPSVIHHFLTHYNLPSITYLDSDLYFVNDPKYAFDEIGTSSIAITEQGISKKAEVMYGKYCVQFMFFRNDENGLKALTWWRDSCIEWCYQRFEDGRYGDQKYLEAFPTKFNNVYVIQNPGVGIAPWNMYRYEYKNYGKIVVYNKKEYPSVFFHMHAIKVDADNKTLVLRSTDAIINKHLEECFFRDYASLLSKAANDYLDIRVEHIKVCGLSKWRRVELELRSTLNKNVKLRSLYYRLFGMTEHNSGTRFN